MCGYPNLHIRLYKVQLITQRIEIMNCITKLWNITPFAWAKMPKESTNPKVHNLKCPTVLDRHHLPHHWPLSPRCSDNISFYNSQLHPSPARVWKEEKQFLFCYQAMRNNNEGPNQLKWRQGVRQECYRVGRSNSNIEIFLRAFSFTISRTKHAYD